MNNFDLILGFVILVCVIAGVVVFRGVKKKDPG